MVRFSLVIPFVDEVEAVKRTFKEYAEEFPDAEIILVQNNCSFWIGDIGEDKYFYLKECEGKGAAIIKGVEAASHGLVGFTDADGSTSAAEFRKLLEAYDSHPSCCMVIGKRLVQNKRLVRHFGSFAYNSLVRLLFRTGISDHQAGCKVY